MREKKVHDSPQYMCQWWNNTSNPRECEASSDDQPDSISGKSKKSNLFAKTLNGYIIDLHYLPIDSYLATF